MDALGWTALADDILGPSRTAKTAAREQLLGEMGVPPAKPRSIVAPGTSDADPDGLVRSGSASLRAMATGGFSITDPEPEDDDDA